MEISLIQDGDEPWITIDGPIHPRFGAVIRAMPRTAWAYDGRKFCVHYSRIRAVAMAAKQIYERVDWSRLPPDWQVMACGGALPSLSGEDPFAVLHLLPSAPVEVARAAHKVLALIAHPDRGGSDGEMQRLNGALAKIIEFAK